LRALVNSQTQQLRPMRPTIAEAGLPNYPFETCSQAPAGTPQPVLESSSTARLNQARRLALKERGMSKEGTPTPSTPHRPDPA
jgi:hypothetical protein